MLADGFCGTEISYIKGAGSIGSQAGSRGLPNRSTGIVSSTATMRQHPSQYRRITYLPEILIVLPYDGEHQNVTSSGNIICNVAR